MADASFVLLDDRGILAVSGPDRRPFLQGLVSNDVERVGPTTARYAAFLTAQGKYLHDFMMVEAAESIWLDTEAARLGDLNGVDGQKGCYIGQELTARTKYRGLVKRRLMPVTIDGPTPVPGTIVTADGREVGEMRSSRDRLGLALLRVEPVRERKELAA